MNRESNARRWATWLLCLLPLAAFAQDEPVPQRYDWRVGVNLQGDGLLNSDVPDEARKDTELRRARLGGRLVLARPLRLSVSADFSQGARLGDLYFDWRNSDVWWQIGRFPEPFGLSAQESSRTAPLMERAQATALGPGYNVGVGLSAAGRRWGFGAGVFKGVGPSSEDDVLKGARKEDAITLRLTGQPWRRLDSLVHLGLDASLRRPNEEAIRFIAIPESVLIEGYQVGSGLLPVEDYYTLLGAEFAWLQGPVLVQAEYLRASIRLDDSLPESNYTGWYAEAAWALSGERRPYSTRYGSFGPIEPESRWNDGGWRGAWELAARYGAVRFDQNPLAGLPDFEDIEDYGLFTGGTGRVASIGLNWYPGLWTRVSLGGLSIHKEREGEKLDARVLQLRVYLQFDLKRSRGD